MRSARHTHAARSGAGLTLVELLVAVTISSIIVTLAMVAWRPLAGQIVALRNRARDGAEMRLAVESLLADMGGAATALPTPEDGELLLVREQPVAELAGAWDGGSGGDAGILYAFANGNLVRQDLSLGTEVLLASHLGAFDVTRIDGDETHILMASGTGQDERTVELVWPE